MLRRSCLGCIELNSIPQSSSTLFFRCVNQVPQSQLRSLRSLLEGLGLATTLAAAPSAMHRVRTCAWDASRLHQDFRSEASVAGHATRARLRRHGDMATWPTRRPGESGRAMPSMRMVADREIGRLADWQRVGALIIALMMMMLTWLCAAAADHLHSSHNPPWLT